MNEAHDAVTGIKTKLLGLGPVLPGSLGKQWNVCGTPGCKCKDPKQPRRHGPYYQLSYTLQGRSSTVFVKPQDVAEVRRCIRRYAQFKRLCGELVAAYVRSIRQRSRNGR